MDALGNPTAFHLTGGQAHDLDGADALLAGITAGALIADRGYDAEARALAPLREADRVAVIPPECHRRARRAYDRDPYAARHLIEHFFCKPKHFRGLATRDDTTKRNVLAGVHVAPRPASSTEETPECYTARHSVRGATGKTRPDVTGDDQ